MASMMTTAKLFQNGQSQAVRLPKAFRLPGKEVYIKKVGNAIVLIPMDHLWETLFESLSQLEIVPFDAVAAAAYGPVRAALERQGTPIGAMDMLIAAHALSLRLTLVTNNTREFARVQGLSVENWAT
jgi:virulence-associated protein VagC